MTSKFAHHSNLSNAMPPIANQYLQFDLRTIKNERHFREVPGQEIFMKQELRFGLYWQKRFWTEYEQYLRVVFSSFQRQKNVEIFIKTL